MSLGVSLDKGSYSNLKKQITTQIEKVTLTIKGTW